jgi:hypothetical protein
MVDAGHSEFDRRLRKLGRKHLAMSHGYTTIIRPDGLIVAEPRRVRVRLPIKGMLLIALAFIGFKGFLLSALGQSTYDDRLSELRAGTIVEKAGAWAMQPDRISIKMAEHLGPILR